ncbi:MAG: type III secretion system chaperone [Actinomycetota bacterium]
MSSPQLPAPEVIERYLGASPESFEWERVRPDFYYVRIRVPSLYLGWLPVELSIGQRTLKITGGFSVKPHASEADALSYLLRLNLEAPGFTFAIDSENRIVLVGRVALERLDGHALDAAFGRIVEITETCVGSYLSIGFGN